MYIGEMVTKWEGDRDMIIQERASFSDPDTGLVWWVGHGNRINGLSVPSLFQRVFGTPYTGPARIPAAFHDVHYQKREREKHLVDKMFLDAMIYSDVDPWKANAMYIAVCSTGRTWAEYDARNDEEEDDD